MSLTMSVGAAAAPRLAAQMHFAQGRRAARAAPSRAARVRVHAAVVEKNKGREEAQGGSTGKTQLEQLAAMTTVVADSGDFQELQAYRPEDATTNPSLVFQAAQKPEYEHLLMEAVAFGKAQGGSREEQVGAAMDYLSCLFGREISHVVPGYVSTEVDARLSFDTEASVAKAKKLLQHYVELGVDPSRILIKLASTWEMLEACEVLEQEGIKTNMTLLFSPVQAIAAAQRGAHLISPFVGRILDWYKKKEGVDSYPPPLDPGVQSVQGIYNYYRCHGVKTIVMGASFRNKDEILELAGCDRLTIAPKLLKELEASTAPVVRKLDPKSDRECELPHDTLDQKTFRWMLNDDAMATEKLAEGIRGFTADIVKLEELLTSKF